MVYLERDLLPRLEVQSTITARTPEVGKTSLRAVRFVFRVQYASAG